MGFTGIMEPDAPNVKPKYPALRPSPNAEPRYRLGLIPKGHALRRVAHYHIQDKVQCFIVISRWLMLFFNITALPLSYREHTTWINQLVQQSTALLTNEKRINILLLLVVR